MNRLKKKIVIGILFGLYINDITAQKLYLELGGGYGLSIASQNLTSKIDNGIAHSDNVLVKGSFGKGLNVEGNVGYKCNNNIGIELGVSYLKGAKYKGYYNQENVFTDNTTLTATMFRVAPAIRLTVGEKKMKPYIRIGAVCRVFGNIIIKDSYNDIQNNRTTESEWKYSKGFSIGVVSALGATYSMNDKFAIFAELNFVNQSWGPKKSKCTKYEINGTDNLPNLNPYQKETEFSNSYSVTNSNPSGYDPRQQLRQYFPFSSAGINIGIHFTFGKNKSNEETKK